MVPHSVFFHSLDQTAVASSVANSNDPKQQNGCPKQGSLYIGETTHLQRSGKEAIV